MLVLLQLISELDTKSLEGLKSYMDLCFDFNNHDDWIDMLYSLERDGIELTDTQCNLLERVVFNGKYKAAFGMHGIK